MKLFERCDFESGHAESVPNLKGRSADTGREPRAVTLALGPLLGRPRAFGPRFGPAGGSDTVSRNPRIPQGLLGGSTTSASRSFTTPPRVTDRPEEKLVTEHRRVSMASLLEAVVRVPDPRDRLRKLRTLEDGISDLADRLRVLKREAIVELRAEDPRPTFEQIGELLGVSGSRAEQLSKP